LQFVPAMLEYKGGLNMKKQSVINLVKFFVEKNDSAFRNEVCEIASDFEKSGEHDISAYLMDLISTSNFYIPQNNYKDLIFLKKSPISSTPLILPEPIKNDVLGLAHAVGGKIPVNKVIFYGKPGSGKTESAYQIARLLNRDLLSVNMESLIDSHLGQTSKNIVLLFDEINRLSSQNVVILFDELDSLVMNRVNGNDLREMGRVTSTFIKELEQFPQKTLLIATTNLIDNFDSALLRRFDAKISFDRYSKEDLIEISNSLLQIYLKKAETSRTDTKLFTKILENAKQIPYPGEMIQLIKISLAFSDETTEYGYLHRFYSELNHDAKPSPQILTEQGFTTREIQVITGIPKSSVSRIVRAKSK
jgi:hypothetical protein